MALPADFGRWEPVFPRSLYSSKGGLRDDYYTDVKSVSRLLTSYMNCHADASVISTGVLEAVLMLSEVSSILRPVAQTFVSLQNSLWLELCTIELPTKQSYLSLH
jgi:hypothetical protein